MSTKRTVRAGLTLPPEDFEANIAALSTKWEVAITPEQAMSSLLYPKVFSDYMKKQATKGGKLIRLLSTPVYLHGMVPGGPPMELNMPSSDGGDIERTVVSLIRVGPLKGGNRTVSFMINGSAVHDVTVKDSTGKFVYEGALATPGDATTV